MAITGRTPPAASSEVAPKKEKPRLEERRGFGGEKGERRDNITKETQAMSPAPSFRGPRLNARIVIAAWLACNGLFQGVLLQRI
jgi:hypothetical protein